EYGRSHTGPASTAVDRVSAAEAADGGSAAIPGGFGAGGDRGSVRHTSGDSKKPIAAFAGNPAREGIPHDGNGESMSRLDDELKFALGRVDPPPGFAERVVAGAGGRRPSRWWPGAIAAAVLLAAGVEIQRDYRQRAEGERAKEKVLLALRITSSKLQIV